MWSISGMLVIPTDPQLSEVKTNNGFYLNFKGVTQGRGGGDVATYQYWECAMWVPEQRLDEWKDKIKPGHVLYIEHGYAVSYPVLEGKYFNTKVKLDFNHTKHLKTPMWVKDKE